MATRRATQLNYVVSVYDDPDSPGALRFSFVPKNVRRESSPVEPVLLSPQYLVSVQGHGDETKFHWIKEPAQRESREFLQEVARERVTAREAWLAKLRDLVAKVKKWGEELDWATRIVDKKMEDAEIGNYKAPSLLLQQETVRLFLEPIARKAPGAEGLVDLCRMPAYDDIASLVYGNGKWHVHYAFEKMHAAGSTFEDEAKPFSKATLRSLLDEMKAHAG